ncbi:MAG: hypothetical protein LGR52_10340 [Candidatus Thiosymbion ectosymbiont of Robbea hypermnestra]|nr:hypothetical protein [Candidatus Thiosymbion ectosymbiont of Robbea hypermnestra]
MRKFFTTLLQTLQTLQILFGGISAAIGIIGVVAMLLDKGKTVAGFLAGIGLPSAIWLPVVLAGLLLAVGAWLLWRGLTRKSRLLRPECLVIDPDSPDHLRGRAEDVSRLQDAVAHRLVFLEGKSGAGKSALIRSGLIPALRNSTGPRPAQVGLVICLNSYPGDWEQGLHERLVDAFWGELGRDDLRRRLRVGDRNDLRDQLLPTAGPSPLLARIRAELGPPPLVIFDQFDDYQIAHRTRFLRDGRWIGADELTRANAV